MGNNVQFTLYSFYGGELDGVQFPREMVEAIAEGHTPDYAVGRKMGGLYPRKELDNQPTVAGYCGPMWDGYRHVMEDGTVKHDYEITDTTQIRYSMAVLRYETPEFYGAMSI